MRFRDQLRDWLHDLWADFWGVSPRRLAAALALVAWAFAEAALRFAWGMRWISGETYGALWPFVAVGGFAVLFFVGRAFDK